MCWLFCITIYTTYYTVIKCYKHIPTQNKLELNWDWEKMNWNCNWIEVSKDKMNWKWIGIEKDELIPSLVQVLSLKITHIMSSRKCKPDLKTFLESWERACQRGRTETPLWGHIDKKYAKMWQP